MANKYTIEDAPAQASSKYTIEDEESPAPKKSTIGLLLSRDPSLTEIQPHQAVHSASDLGREVVRGVGNVGAGGLGMVLHPKETAKGIGRFLEDPFVKGHPAATQLVESLSSQPLETLESMLGQAAVAGGAGEVAEAGAKVPGKVGRLISKTTPKEMGTLVEKTQDANRAATEDAADKTRKLQEQHAKDVEKIEGKRKVELKKHFEKTSEAKAANEAAQGKVSRKEAINRGVERLDTEVRGDLEKLKDKVNKEGNRKYNDLKKVLKNENADRVQPLNEQGQPIGQPKNITEYLDDVAHAPLRGGVAETPIMKSLSKRVEKGEINLTYDDLQGYREEIGRELSKGTLQPDIYTSYKNLMSAIDDAMDKIATRKGLKPLQDAARAYWRQYAETFIDRGSPAQKALESEERGGVGKAYQGMDQSGIEQIAKFDPAVAQRLNTLRGYQGEAKSLPSKTGKLASMPKLEPKPATPAEPAPVRPVLNKIEPEGIRGAKKESMAGREKKVRTGYSLLLSSFPAYDAIRSLISGNLKHAAMDVAARGGYEVGKQGIAAVLRNPAVIRLLTRPTAADVAQIPADLRGNLQPILDAARQNGIQVDPRFYAAAGVPQGKRVGDILRDPFMAIPNPKGMVEKGNLPIWNRPVIQNADGSHSSEYSTSFEDDQGREVLVPTVVGGKFLTPDGKKPPEGSAAEKAMFKAAWDHFLQTGENLGKFDNPDDADAYAGKLHSRGPQ